MLWISVAISVVAILVSLYSVLVERNGGYGQLLRDALIDIYSNQQREDRRLLYSLAPNDFDHWVAEERKTAERVAVFFDRMGLLIHAKYLPKDEFLNKWGDIIGRCYVLCEPLILNRRKNEQVQHHFVHFEWLARVAIMHSRKKAWWDTRSWRRLCRRTDAKLLEIVVPGPTATSLKSSVQREARGSE